MIKIAEKKEEILNSMKTSSFLIDFILNYIYFAIIMVFVTIIYKMM